MTEYSTSVDDRPLNLNDLKNFQKTLTKLSKKQFNELNNKIGELQYRMDNFDNRLKATEQFPKELLTSHGRPSTFRSYAVGSSVSGETLIVRTGFSR